MAPDQETELVHKVGAKATLEAKETGRPLPAKLSDAFLDEAERNLGYGLPTLLKRLYTEVADGGFGPGYGLTPFKRPLDSFEGETVVSLHREFCSSDPEDPAWEWPSSYIPICDWGCAIRSCLDANSAAGSVVTFDPNGHEVGESVDRLFAKSHNTLTEWLSDWVEGIDLWDRMMTYQELKVVNPFTKEETIVRSPMLRRPYGADVI